ncbi:MAG: hypothetical protein J4F43_11255 [Dehalococcoidia bacterium]|nr:hypothetical protein [Dehalococcoidia bacterium]
MGAILNGIISGVAAGVVVSVILGCYGLVDSKLKRREQISHIREMIATDRAQIYGVPEDTDLPSDPNRPPSSAFRYVLFDGMRRELQLALDGRSSELTFDEIRQVRRAFILSDLLKQQAPNSHPVGMRYYDQIFEALEQIAWLKLPKMVSGDDG